MAADQSDIIASIRLGLDQLEKDIKTAQAKVTTVQKNIEGSGQKAGKGFSAGMTKGFTDVGNAGQKLAGRLASMFGPAALAMMAFSAAMNFVKKAIEEAAQKAKEHKAAVDLLNTSYHDLMMQIEGQVIELTKKEKAEAAANAADKVWLDQQLGINSSIKDYIAAEEEAILIRKKNEAALMSEASAKEAMAKTQVQHNVALKEQTLLEQVLGTGTDAKARLSIEESYLKTLFQELSVLEAQGQGQGAIAQQLRERLSVASQNIKIWEKEVKAQEDSKKTKKVVLGEVEKRLQIEKDIAKKINEINTAAANETKHLKDNQGTQEEINNIEKERQKNLKEIYQLGVSQLDTLAAEFNVNEKLSPKLFAQREAWADSRDAIKEIVDYTQAQKDLMNEISDAMMEQAIASAGEKGDILTQVDLQKQLIEAQRQRAMEAMQQTDEFKAFLPEVQAQVLADFQSVTDGMKHAAEESIREAAKTRKDILNEQGDAIAQIAITEAQKNAALTGDIKTQIELENKLMKAQRERERDELMASAAYLTAINSEDEETQKAAKSMIKNFDAITESMKKPVTAADQFNAAMNSTIGKAAQSVANGTMDMVTNIGGMMVDQLQKDTEEAIANIDAQLEIKKAEIEAARQAALEEAGFIEASTAENMQAKIDAAKEAGDEVLQYELERKQREMEINEEFDAKQKAAEEQAEHEKLELKYKADTAAWKMDMVNAGISMAKALLEAVTSGMQFGVAAPVMIGVLTAMAATMGGIQLGILQSNKPKPPQFADGGIVPGNPALGDVQQIVATGGEGVFTADQMEAMGIMANSGGGQTIVLNATFMLDTETIGKATFKWANANGAVLDARAIIGRA